MDHFQGFSTGDEDSERRSPFPPNYQHNLQLHKLLATTDNGLHQKGVSKQIATQQLDDTDEVSETSASLEGSGQDYTPYQQPRKRKMGQSDDHFPASQFPPSDPSSSVSRPDPPADIPTKRPKVMPSTNPDAIFVASSAPSYSSLPNNARGTLHSFPKPGNMHSRFQSQAEGLQTGDPYRAIPQSRAPPSASGSGLEMAQLATSRGRAEPRLSEISNSKGGIFDDADSEDESMNVIQQDPVFPKPTIAAAPSEVAPAANTGGGIFDDAEEELEFVPPTYDSIAPIENEKPCIPLSLPKVSSMPPKAEVKAVVNQNHFQDFKPVKSKKPAPAKRATSPVPSNAKSKTAAKRAASPLPADTKSKTGGAKKSAQKNKKKPVKPTKRVLVAKKERDLATSVLDGKDDLREIIHSSHCDFLGKEFWMFTIQQLDYVLGESDVSPTSGEDETRARETRELLRRELVLKVARSQLVSGVEQELSPDPNHEDEQAAETLLNSWRNSIEDWKRRDQSERDIPHEKKFPLDGPARWLFHPNIRRFLASVPILSLYDFLCLKKTETGAIIAYCAIWRKECGLSSGTPLALAKHFLGMGLRAETALTSIPPADPCTRKWMGDPLVVLTGAAKEFLIDERKIFSGKTFIETRTKDLANALMEWRTKKGLPPLKGSGKVAMVSGWKANVKEAIDLEEGEGKVISVDFQAIVAEEADDPSVPKEEVKKAPVPAKPPPQEKQEFTFDPRIPDVDAALHSRRFLREVMDPKHFAVLQAAGIKTAVELFAAQKKHGSPLAREVSKVVQDPSQFELVIFDWCQIVRKRLSGIRRVHPTPKKKGDPVPDPPETKKKKKEKQPTEAKKEATPRPSKAQLLQKDPFYSLSAVTQTFLKTLGIETAEAFMTSRTTDLSSAFVEFRAKNGMSVLKGLGAIASVSGWKAQVRKMAKERGLEELAAAAPPAGAGPMGSPKTKTKLVSDPPATATKEKQPPVPASPPLKKTTSSPKLVAGAPESKIVLSHPDVLFGRPSKKLVVESARDPRIRFYFEISIRKKPTDVSLFISYIGARKLTTVNSDYSRIHQRHFSIVDDGNDVSDVSLLVAKDLSKKIKKDPNSSSAAGKDIRVPFSSLEDGCGLIELCKHDVWPLPCQGEAEMIWPALEGFICMEQASEINYESNVVVGKDETGRSQYFLFLQDPLERGQTVEIQFCSPKSKKRSSSTVVPLDNQWRTNVEGMLSRMSRRGLRSLLKLVSGAVEEKIDKRIYEISKDDCGGDWRGNCSDHNKVFVSRRRAHWIASKIVSQLQGQETKGAKTKSGGLDLAKEIGDSYDRVAWTPQLVAKLKEHPLWTESTVAAIENEIQEEFEAGIKSNEFLNKSSRRRWCLLAKDLFESLLPRIKKFSGFLDPCLTQQSILTEVREASLTFAKHLRDVQADSNAFEKLLMTFEEFTDGLPCASPSLKHVLQTSVEQAYKDALALCGVSAVEIAVPQVQQVIATSSKSSAPIKAAPLSEKEAKEASKKPEEASFRALEDVTRGSAKVHQAWYLRFQLLQVLNSLLSVSGVLLEGGVSLKVPTLKSVESALLKSGVEELTKFEKSTLSVLAGTPVTFTSEVTGCVYQPNPLPLFLGLIWPTLRSSHWKVEAGETPTDYSFLPPGQRGRRQSADKRARMLKQERTKSRIKLAKAANDLGLGIVPKLTKRVFVNAVGANADELKASQEQFVPPTAGVALERFLQKTKSEMREDNVDGQNRAELVVNQIKEAFDALSTLDSSVDCAEGKRPSDSLGCDHLARFVLIAPSILCQAQLSEHIVEDTTLLLKELASFLALQHKELFAPSLCPPNEVYMGDTTQPSILASRLEKPRSASDGPSNLTDLTEAILPEDRPDVTDFIDVVMSQVVPCRATQEDTAKKNRRISIGFTGMMCRHCRGSKGEGRYFFTSIESMTTAATVIEKHIQKCPMVAPDIKAKMAEARSRHAEQRKYLGQGSQAAFFLRLWERLRASKVKDMAASLQILEMNDKQDPDDEPTPGGLEFESHVRVIEFLKKTQPWSERQDIMEALQRYYEGMEYGGRLYKTDAMPKNFNSEWLLSKMLASTAAQPQAEPPATVTNSKPPAKNHTS